MSGARVILAEENRQQLLTCAAEYLVYLDESLELTLAEYVKSAEPQMRKPRWFGFQKPYWTSEASPEPADVDQYWRDINAFAWVTSRTLKNTHAEVRENYNIVLKALINGDVVELSQTMYDELVTAKEPKSWRVTF